MRQSISDWKSSSETWKSRAWKSERISNNYGEIKIDKDITEDRIDPIDAIIDAWKLAMKDEYKPDANDFVSEWLALKEQYKENGGENR